MQIINISKGGVESGVEGAVVAIGNFDGVHLGHQAIIRMVQEEAKRRKAPAGIITFDPSPYAFFKTQENFQLTTLTQKAKILKGMGLDFVACADFNEELSKTSAADFVKNILVGKLKVAHVFTGTDFRFGHKAQGNSELLGKMAKELGFNYTAIENILGPEGQKYRSSVVRNFLMEGKIKEAEEIMGRSFEIEGEVIKGAQRGREIGFPTANVDMGHYFLPKFGVYEVVVSIQNSEFKGVANIGVKPTVSGDNKPLLEVHIPNFSDDIYGKTISVKLLSFVRKEMKFQGIEELREQIRKDVGTIER